MTATMQRWSMDALGRESLRLIQEPVPQPGPGEVRVRVNAVALNYRDKMVIEGTMPIPLSFPFTPASDMAGVVDSIGDADQREYAKNYYAFQTRRTRHLNLLPGMDRRQAAGRRARFAL